MNGYEEMAKRLLSEKYDDKFVVETIQSVSALDEYYWIVVKMKSLR